MKTHSPAKTSKHEGVNPRRRFTGGDSSSGSKMSQSSASFRDTCIEDGGISTTVCVYIRPCARINQNMEREIDMLCKLIEESQKEATTLLSYAYDGTDTSTKTMHTPWQQPLVATPTMATPTMATATMATPTNNVWGHSSGTAIAYSTPTDAEAAAATGVMGKGGLWTPTAVSLNVKTFLLPML